jgi:HSP20 family molecular chaperone IbpA
MHGSNDQNERRVKAREGIAQGDGGAPAGRVIAPAVDIYEEADRLHVVADLPGVKTDGVKLDVVKDVLTISARFTGEGILRGEAAYSELAPIEYHRAFALGEDLDPGRITATMKDGVLELVLPKAERAKTRKVKIEQG